MTRGLGTVCNSLYGSTVLCLADDDRSGLHRGRQNWPIHMRNARMGRTRGLFFELWTQSGFSQDLAMEGNTWDSDEYEEWCLGEGGKRATYYVKGQVLDANSDPIGGAVINAFRTSDNLFVGTCSSDSYGNYVCPTPYPGVAHFIVAYLDVATDLSGTTVNNIMPTVS